MKHSSVAKLKSTTTKDTNVHLRDSGFIIMKYDNISKNECPDNSALFCFPSNSSFVSYTSFENNTAINCDVIFFDNYKEYYMNTCNVIGNDAQNNYAIIYIRGSLKILNSCLIENTKTAFYVGNNGINTCTIINCTIDNAIVNEGGSVTVDNSSIPSESFINNLDYNGCFLMNDSNSKCVCRTFNMIGKRCNMLRRRDNYIFLII